MNRLPPFFALRALEAAARHGSYSRAAEELAVTHGAVSQQIRRLETGLGARLFERRGNRMEPSPQALRLAGEVGRAFEILRKGVRDFTGADVREPLVVSVGGYMARRWLPARLPRLITHPAGANLDIRVENRHVDLVAEGVDVGVRSGTGRWPDLESRHLFGEIMVPVCSPALAAAHPIRTPRDLLSVPLLHSIIRPWSLWFAKFGLESPPQEGGRFDDPLMVLEAAAQGLGVALAVDGLMGEHLEAGRLVKPLGSEVGAERGMFLVWRADNPKLARIHALRDWFVAEATEERVAAGAATQPEA
ncbi:LysR substrate-binding domain-containing protein [Phenylobacterium sp.]|uniref:LysR substrate-binding domain-containing protein n=1 Tax=Phenylobacterium sp. TaxID=1871053 RepID=UPI003567CB27